MFAGFFGFVVYSIFIATAFNISSSSDIGLINLLNYLWPIWIVVNESSIDGEKSNLYGRLVL